VGTRRIDMSNFSLPANIHAKAAISALFANAPPVLVEVRFPNSGTSPDWYLCEEEEELERILERLGPGAELHLSSVWDLKNTKGAICLKK
jgi:hypothetical protein